MKWINFMLDKDVAITNYEYLTYSIPNISVIDYVKNDESKMSVLFPADEILQRCEALKSLGKMCIRDSLETADYGL